MPSKSPTVEGSHTENRWRCSNFCVVLWTTETSLSEGQILVSNNNTQKKKLTREFHFNPCINIASQVVLQEKKFFLGFCHLFICFVCRVCVGDNGGKDKLIEWGWPSTEQQTKTCLTHWKQASKQAKLTLVASTTHTHTHTHTHYCQLIRSVCQSFTCSKRPPPFTCKSSTIQVNSLLFYFMLVKDSLSPSFSGLCPGASYYHHPTTAIYMILKLWGVSFISLK
jgi:hypothetical protein